MSERDRDSSDPPPSPPSRRRTDREWRPASSDLSLEAADWRARRGLALAEKHETAIERLSDTMDKLGAVFKAGADAAAERWATARKLAWALGVPLLLAALLGAGALAWQFLSTLHH